MCVWVQGSRRLDTHTIKDETIRRERNEEVRTWSQLNNLEDFLVEALELQIPSGRMCVQLSHDHVLHGRDAAVQLSVQTLFIVFSLRNLCLDGNAFSWNLSF